jgi:hypothetical protein
MLKRILFLATLLLAPLAAQAQTYNDQVVLANDAIFIQRVRQAIMFEAINISTDGLTTGINLKRHAQVQSIMNNPDGWKQLFAEAIVGQPSTINAATATGTVVLKPMICPGGVTTASCTETGNVDAQQALVTDANINNSVLFVYNAFFGGQ